MRGFSTDQRIDIEKLNVQQRMLNDRRDETTIVALSIEESAIGRQLNVAEKRAEQRCPEYNATNIYWKRVDELIEDQQSVMDRIKSFNSTVDTSNQNTDVSKFLNQDSPIKNTKKRSIEEVEALSSDGDSEVEGFLFSNKSNAVS